VVEHDTVVVVDDLTLVTKLHRPPQPAFRDRAGIPGRCVAVAGRVSPPCYSPRRRSMTRRPSRTRFPLPSQLRQVRHAFREGERRSPGPPQRWHPRDNRPSQPRSRPATCRRTSTNAPQPSAPRPRPRRAVHKPAPRAEFWRPTGPSRPQPTRNHAHPRATLGPSSCPAHPEPEQARSLQQDKIIRPLLADSGQRIRSCLARRTASRRPSAPSLR
jgi:hypothetical protein